MGDYRLCTWRVRSEWPLPELPIWAGDDRPVDISIHLGPVPEMLPGSVVVHPLVQVNEHGWLRYSIHGVADYLVRGGDEIIIDTPHGPGTPDVALFLLGSVLGFLCHQRSLLPLHGSCVEIDGRAFALVGHSGVGKSTVAALLLSYGARLMSDDVTVVDLHSPDGPLVLPTYPRQKLWLDTIDALGLAPGRRLRETVALEKFDQGRAGQFQSEPMRLSGIFRINVSIRGGAPRLVLAKGLPAVRLLYENVYRRTAGALLGSSEHIFQGCASLAARTPARELVVPSGLDALIQQAGCFAELLEGPL